MKAARAFFRTASFNVFEITGSFVVVSGKSSGRERAKNRSGWQHHVPSRGRVVRLWVVSMVYGIRIRGLARSQQFVVPTDEWAHSYPRRCRSSSLTPCREDTTTAEDCTRLSLFVPIKAL